VGFRKFLKRIGVIYPDPIKVAGGAKCLASPEGSADCEFVLDQIRKSIRLHQTTRVILMVHSDCGAYGGLEEAFDGDRERELQHLRDDLKRAIAHLSKAIPGLKIDAYFVDFEGVWEPRLEITAAP